MRLTKKGQFYDENNPIMLNKHSKKTYTQLLEVQEYTAYKFGNKGSQKSSEEKGEMIAGGSNLD